VEPAAWTEIDGGRDALDRAFRSVKPTAEAKQTRFAEVLDKIGPPGRASWDPIGGTIMLRGRTFRAQQLGSFDGRSWLWAWANTHLNIPDEMTTLARAFRDAADKLELPALYEPMIADSDEELPKMLGGIAVAHGFGEAFFYANQSQVYLVLPGQLDELARRPPQPTRFATMFSHTQRSLAEIVTQARTEPRLAGLAWTQLDDDRATLAGTGYMLSLQRRDVAAELAALPQDNPARGAVAAFSLEGLVSTAYAELTFGIAYGAWMPDRGRLPWQVLAICERVNSLDRIVVHDALLEDFYPR